ncbi:hypothetical protein UPYG_G00203480 [Umbra pygmaea]|uniref:Uncharacterized protein n=1 Tax=Umbra pygmaea TaxID=75934 RepID=A0ABD0WJM7_UMBPY
MECLTKPNIVPLPPQEDCKGPDNQSGYRHIQKLARALVEVKNLEGLSERRDRIERGQFKASKGKSSISAGKESLQRCFLGLNSGPATWPGTSRLVEAISSKPCRLHPCGTQSGGIKRSSQRTISQWYSRRQKERERSVLEQGLGLARGLNVAPEPLPEVKQPHYRPPDLQPFVFAAPKDLSRQATKQGRPSQVLTLPVLPVLSAHPQQQPPCSLPHPSQVAPPPAVAADYRLQE